MSKRAAQFKRRARDFYPTPASAVAPLLAHLLRNARFYEPCAGDGALLRAMPGCCTGASDIEPQLPHIEQLDVSGITESHAAGAEYFVTNPPWPRPGGNGEPVIGMINHLSGILPTWLLLPHDFCANLYFSKVSITCAKIVPVGRVSWMGSGTPGKDNASWYLFDAKHIGATNFCARAA